MPTGVRQVLTSLLFMGPSLEMRHAQAKHLFATGSRRLIEYSRSCVCTPVIRVRCTGFSCCRKGLSSPLWRPGCCQRASSTHALSTCTMMAAKASKAILTMPTVSVGPFIPYASSPTPAFPLAHNCTATPMERSLLTCQGQSGHQRKAVIVCFASSKNCNALFYTVVCLFSHLTKENLTRVLCLSICRKRDHVIRLIVATNCPPLSCSRRKETHQANTNAC